MKQVNRVLPVTLSLLVASFAFADVEVVDAYDGASVKPEQQAMHAAEEQLSQSLTIDQKVERLEQLTKSLSGVELLARVNRLEAKVRELQGLVEVQQHELQKVAKTERADEHSAEKVNLATQLTVPQPEKVASTKLDMMKFTGNEKTDYELSYALIQARNFPEATQAFIQFIEKYPSGNYTPNALYWLGELNLQNKQYEQAIDAFNSVVERYPNHAKAADASLKIGYVYFNKGDNERARDQLLKVMQLYPATASARIASARLQQLSLAAK